MGHTKDDSGLLAGDALTSAQGSQLLHFFQI